ncbi:MAG TPA: RNA-binding protein, partial [Acidimicrobiia bacterium]
MKIYVGNLPWSYTSSDLRRLFEAFGAVSTANVVVERDTGRSRGFGFVEMDSDEEAKGAVETLNGSDCED